MTFRKHQTTNGTALNGYGNLLGEIRKRIRSAQYAALRAVNRELIGLYRDIGRMIVERQAREKWGRAVVERLAADLQVEFPGIRGFSVDNMWRMRKLYITYSNNEKLAQLVPEIGWSHNILILQKCKDDLQREFYIRMTRKMGWTVNILTHHIDNNTYEKTLLNQVNFEKLCRRKSAVRPSWRYSTIWYARKMRIRRSASSSAVPRTEL